MEALYLLIPLSVAAVFAAAWVFLRMSESGQFDDMDGPAWSILHDDDRPPAAHEHAPQTQSDPAQPLGRPVLTQRNIRCDPPDKIRRSSGEFE